MQDLTMFYLEGCPYCKRARGYMEELRGEDDRYAQVPVEMIEEREQADLADTFDYYYVPCYYIGNEKISEGAVDKDGVRAVFDRCLAD